MTSKGVPRKIIDEEMKILIISLSFSQSVSWLVSHEGVHKLLRVFLFIRYTSTKLIKIFAQSMILFCKSLTLLFSKFARIGKFFVVHRAIFNT